jgi:hypothetical protein
MLSRTRSWTTAPTSASERCGALTSVPSDDDAVWLERLADERHNVRAALAHSRDRCDAVALSRLCASYWFAWYFVRDASDGLDWVHAALELGPPADLLPRLENAASALWLRTHGREQLDTALELAQAAAEHARELNDALAESMAVLTLGNGLSHRDEDAACEAWSQARRLAAGAVEPWWQMCATSCLFGTAIDRADVEWAKTELQVMRSLVQQFGACAFFDLDDMAALVEWELGNVDVLRVRLSGWLDEFSRHDALRVEELFLLAAELAAHDGDARRAIMLIAAAYADTQAAGLAIWPSLKRESFEAALREKVSVAEWVAGTTKAGRWHVTGLFGLRLRAPGRPLSRLPTRGRAAPAGRSASRSTREWRAAAGSRRARA